MRFPPPITCGACSNSPVMHALSDLIAAANGKENIKMSAIKSKGSRGQVNNRAINEAGKRGPFSKHSKQQRKNNSVRETMATLLGFCPAKTRGRGRGGSTARVLLGRPIQQSLLGSRCGRSHLTAPSAQRAPRHGVLPPPGTCGGEHMPVLRTPSPRASGRARDIPSHSTNDIMPFVNVAVLEPGSCRMKMKPGPR